MKKYLLLLSSFYFSLQLFAQSAKTDAIYFPPTTQQNRAKLYKQMVDTTIRLNLNDPLADSTEGEWNEAFWSIELLVYKNDFVYCVPKSEYHSKISLFQNHLLLPLFCLNDGTISDRFFLLSNRESPCRARSADRVPHWLWRGDAACSVPADASSDKAIPASRPCRLGGASFYPKPALRNSDPDRFRTDDFPLTVAGRHARCDCRIRCRLPLLK